MPGWTRSLRWRLLGATLLTVALALAGAGWSLVQLFRDHAQAQFEAQLLMQLDQLTAAFELDEQQRPRLSSPLSDPRWQKPYSGLYWQIEAIPPSPDQTDLQHTVWRSRSLWDHELLLPDDQLNTEELHRHRAAGPGGQSLWLLERRVQFIAASAPETLEGTEPVRSQPSWRLVVAADDAALAEAVTRFTGSLALYLGILAAALLAAAGVQVHLGLKPLRTLQRAVQSLRRGNANRLGGDFPSEVQPLVQDFNRVLNQNEEVVQRARHLAGNLAHAIKTPLSVIGNLADDNATDRPTLSRQLREQVDRVRDQVDWHLSRARRSGAGLPGQHTDVAPVIEGLVRVMRKVHGRRDDRPELLLEIAPLPPQLRFVGESEDLQEMVGNLLDNACKWARGRVRVQATEEGESWCLSIDDDGPGLTEAQREAVFERGVRADERAPGSGLGLSIARDTAALYRGHIDLGPSDLGGLRAALWLPRERL